MKRLAVLAVPLLCLASASAQVTECVSTTGTPWEIWDSVSPAITADGRLVAFCSELRTLVPDDNNDCRDVFVYDRVTKTHELVSVSRRGTQGNGSAMECAISDSGRFIAFRSFASNLTGDIDGAWYPDYFLRDRLRATTRMVNVSSSGEQGVDGYGNPPSISANGRLVAFASEADNYVPDDTNGAQDIFVHDRVTRETIRVSVSSSGEEANGRCGYPVISRDGRSVAFSSAATNLVPDDNNGASDVFLHDLQTGDTQRVSISSSGGEAGNWSGIKAISADGRFVVFVSEADDLVPNDTNGEIDVFVHDSQTGETTRVSVSSDGAEGNSDSDAFSCSISGDGRFVAFASYADSLVPDDRNGYCDVFVHDRSTHETKLVSFRADGRRANGGCHRPSISADGSLVAFDSEAGNLLGGTAVRDVDRVFVGKPGDPPVLAAGPPALESSYVSPDVGDPGWYYDFYVTLQDNDDDEPTRVKLVLRKNGQSYRKLSMWAVKEGSRDEIPRTYFGRRYRQRLKLDPGRYTYRIVAEDDDGPAVGRPTELQGGPLIRGTPPFLTWEGGAGYESDGCDPEAGTADETQFRFKVTYWSADNEVPTYVRVVLWKGGVFDRALRMVPVRGSTLDYTRGVTYRAFRRLSAGSYSYAFRAKCAGGVVEGVAGERRDGPLVAPAGATSVCGLTAVPTNAGAHITFGLSSAAQVEARILNIAGRPVRTLCHAKDCEAGTNTLLWNADSDRGLAVPNGTYLVEVTAKAEDGPQARALGQVRVSR